MPLKDKKKLKKYNKQYHINHREQIAARHKQYYLDNIEKRIEKDKEYYRTHKEQKREYNKKYWQTEIGKATRQRGDAKRRTNEKNIINTLTFQEWEDILEEHNYVCVYCGVEFDCELLPEKDHVIPVSKGGNNTKENIVPACRSCNSKKYNRLEEGI